MSLVVEDGSGVVGAESYVSVAYYAAYAEARGLEALDDTTVENRARLATEYLDSYKRLKGVRKTTTQGLEFPRDGMVDWSARDVIGLPKRVQDAVCYLISTGETLFVDADRGGMIKSETVGPLSTTYQDGAPTGKVFTAFDRIMAQYYREDGGLPPSPYFTSDETDTVAESSFSIGMMDYSSGSQE